MLDRCSVQHNQPVHFSQARSRVVPVATAEWLSPRRLETTAKKDGGVVGRGVYEVSDDGKTLTATMTGVDAAGNDVEYVVVWDRESD